VGEKITLVSILSRTDKALPGRSIVGQNYPAATGNFSMDLERIREAFL
jgi:hypothetical protein